MSFDAIRRGRGSPSRRLLYSLSLFVLAACAASCDDDSAETTFPAFDVGAVEGYVRVAGCGAHAVVAAAPTNLNSGQIAYRTTTDSTGWYHLDLPSDHYYISAAPAEQTYFDPVLVSGTIDVGRDVRRVDLNGGSLTLRLEMPASLEGTSFEVEIQGNSGGSWQWRSGVVQGGVLEVLFPMVRPGDVRIGLDTEPRPFWLPGTFDFREASAFAVSHRRPTTVEAAFPDYASVSGEVHGSWKQAGTLRPDVEAFALDSTLVARSRGVRESEYRLDLFLAQPVKLRTRARQASRWVGGETFAEATVHDLRAGDALEGIDIVESGILCTLEGPGERFEHSAILRVRDGTGREFSTSGGTETAIVNLRPGRYFVRVFHECYTGENWASQWYDGADSLSGATPIDLGEGELASVTVHLEQGALIEGRLVGPHVGPGTHVSLELRRTDGSRTCNDYIDHGEPFSFAGVDDGDYRLAAYVSQGLWWYPGTSSPDSAAVIEIRDHASATGLEWRWP